MITEPSFLASGAGHVFAVYHRPAVGIALRGNVLLAAPFNEEMNRCRSMVTLQAKAWAEIGWGTLVIDLPGTGDSEGEHGDARWLGWQQALAAAHQWLAARPAGLRAIWGIRLGAILAAELHASLADPGVALLLWQPVLDGKLHLTQFLRVRMAAQLDRADLPKETTASMRAQWAAGQSVEVAGYEIHPDLATHIDAARLASHQPAAGSRVFWLEQATGEPAEVTPASQALLARWPGTAVQVDTALFNGPAFWQVHERLEAPHAVELTTQWMGRWPMPA